MKDGGGGAGFGDLLFEQTGGLFVTGVSFVETFCRRATLGVEPFP